jgi:hypothetical protein
MHDDPSVNSAVNIKLRSRNFTPDDRNKMAELEWATLLASNAVFMEDVREFNA